MSFEIVELNKPELKNPILIEGLPGIGNVGKIAMDFMIETLKAKRFIEIYSKAFPNSVFVNEKNLVHLPRVSLYYKKIKNQDVIFLGGDVQPLDETACYEFCDIILGLFKKYDGKEIVTMGGIGMPKIPKSPIVYCTANNYNIIKKYKTRELNENIFGVVGPIIGVTGLLVGLSGKKNIPSIALLAQTFGHPNYLGIKGANEILKVLNKKLNLGLNLNLLEKEIKDIEREVRIKTATPIPKIRTIEPEFKDKTSYIG